MKFRLLAGLSVRDGLRDFKINLSNFTAFITAIVFHITGALIIFATVAVDANLSTQQAVSWIMCGSILGALATIFLCLHYQQPIVVMPSLPALLIMGPMFKIFNIREMVAGYLIAALLIFLIGAFGLIGKISKILPVPIIMGMIAGVFMSYGLKMVHAVTSKPLIAGVTVLSFLLANVLFKKIPPLLVTLVTGVALALFMTPMNFDQVVFKLYAPILVTPSFDPQILLSVSVPLVLLALADTLKGYGVLSANGYKTPLNTTTLFAGVVSAVGALFLSHSIVLAGPVTAIVGGESAGDKEHRYVASVLNAVALIVVGVLAGIVLPFVKALPVEISQIIAGLAMLGLFTSSLELAFSSKCYQKGAFTALIIGISGVTAWGLGSPVWAILCGVIVYLFADQQGKFLKKKQVLTD